LHKRFFVDSVEIKFHNGRTFPHFSNQLLPPFLEPSAFYDLSNGTFSLRGFQSPPFSAALNKTAAVAQLIYNLSQIERKGTRAFYIRTLSFRVLQARFRSISRRKKAWRWHPAAPARNT
jgi:hypothetical protein